MATLAKVTDSTGKIVAEYDPQKELYDTTTGTVRPLVKSTRQLIDELGARLEQAEARIAALEAARKV